MRQALVLMLLLCAGACEARVGGNGGADDDDVVDAPSAIDIDATDSAPACSNGRVVYLSFQGETLTQNVVSDSRTNRASWMTIASGIAPRYRTAAADRDQQIQAIVDGVTTQLSSFPITVVTTRPLNGDYVMVVYGGNAGQVGSNFGAAVQRLDCGDTMTRNDVAWVADGINGTQRIVNTTIGAIGFGLGLTATSVPTDCMCAWDNDCQPNNNQACTLTEGIVRDPNANQLCPGVTTQDEVAVFRAGFCQ